MHISHVHCLLSPSLCPLFGSSVASLVGIAFQHGLIGRPSFATLERELTTPEQSVILPGSRSCNAINLRMADGWDTGTKETVRKIPLLQVRVLVLTRISTAGAEVL